MEAPSWRRERRIMSPDSRNRVWRTVIQVAVAVAIAAGLGALNVALEVVQDPEYGFGFIGLMLVPLIATLQNWLEDRNKIPTVRK